jgi:hypothetical protein
MMTKQHFESIADVLKRERPDRDGTRWAAGARDEWSTIVLQFAAMCAAQNARFDRARFLIACGMES